MPAVAASTKGQGYKKKWSDLGSLAKRQQTLLKKLDTRMQLYGSGMFALPINRPVESVSILCRGDDPTSWFRDDKSTCKLLCRVKGLDDEGLAMHLTELAKVFQWILWQPLLADSKTHPERCWREETYSTPSEFLRDMISEKQQKTLIGLCGDRWDTTMMLGGNSNVVQLIKDHIKADNDALKSSIADWMRDLKWHQEWDWERLAETAFFNRAGMFDVYWENESYTVPDRFTEHVVWQRGAKAGVVATLKQKGLISDLSGMEEVKLKTADPITKTVKAARKRSAPKATAKKSKKVLKRRARSRGRTIQRTSRKRLSRRRSVSKKKRSSSKKRSSKKKRSSSRRRSVSRKRRSSSKRKRSTSKKKRSASKRRSSSKKKRSSSRKRSSSKKKRSASKKKRSSSKKKKSKSRSRSKRVKKSRSRSKSRRRASSSRRANRKRSRTRSGSRSKRARRRVSRSRSGSGRPKKSPKIKRRSLSKH